MSRARINAEAADRSMLSTERMGYLQVLRLAFCLLTLASALFAPKALGANVEEFATPTALYLISIGAFEAIRKTRIGNGATTAMLFVDGLYLAWITYASGAAQSPLRFLLYMHVIAVTLLVSHKAGVRIAWWHSLLIFIVFHAQLSEMIPALGFSAEAVDEGGLDIYQPSIFNAIALWLVALGTAPFSSLNERELRRRKGDLEVLADTAQDFENTSTAPQVAAVLVERVCQAFGFSRGVVLAGQDGSLEIMAKYGNIADQHSAPDDVDDAIERAWKARDTLLIGQLGPHDHTLNSLLPGGRNILVAPLVADGQPLGVLVVEKADDKAGLIQRRIVSMVGQFASHGALAMRNAWLLEQVQRLAATDALTGIANRRTFEKVLGAEISRASRNRSDVTLIMLDIDRFKSLNDEFGHQAGDEVLARVGEALRKACRESDTPARYGGEEFAVLMPACSPDEALAATERLRNRIASIEGVRAITFSAGIATFPIHALSPDDLIARADDALYHSKRAGRDRATLSERTMTDEVPIASAES